MSKRTRLGLRPKVWGRPIGDVETVVGSLQRVGTTHERPFAALESRRVDGRRWMIDLFAVWWPSGKGKLAPAAKGPQRCAGPAAVCRNLGRAFGPALSCGPSAQCAHSAPLFLGLAVRLRARTAACALFSTSLQVALSTRGASCRLLRARP